MAAKEAEMAAKDRYKPSLHKSWGIYYKQFRVDGRKITKYLGPDYSEAVAKLARCLDSWERGEVPLEERVGGSEADRISFIDYGTKYLVARKRALDSGLIGQRTYADSEQMLTSLLRHFGQKRHVESLTPRDWSDLRHRLLTEGKNLKGPRKDPVRPKTLQGYITVITEIMNWGAEREVIAPPRFGGGFKKPSKAEVRSDRNIHEPPEWTPAQIRSIFELASVPMRAMLMLSANCGFGPADLGGLKFSHIDFQTQFFKYPRAKTGAKRRGHIADQTMKAVQEYLEVRPEPSEPNESEYVFITRYGKRWWYPEPGRQGSITQETNKILKKLGLYEKGISTYNFRRMFATIAVKHCTQQEYGVTKIVMGHVENDILGQHYNLNTDLDKSLIAVSEKVMDYIFSEPDPPGKKSPKLKLVS